MKPQPGVRGGYQWLAAAMLCYAGALLVYSQTLCFTWDEGYHLLAARLIASGRAPYLDFCFPQTPLNAYWNAMWMRLLGETWRVPQAIAALLTAGAAWLTADYVFARFPVPNWRFSAAIAAGLATGLNIMVWVYGPVAQAYGICLLMLVAAFRAAVRAADGGRLLPAAACGLFSGAAAASSLLTAVALPVMLAWILRYPSTSGRRARLAAFLAGAFVPFAPVLWLFVRGPRQAWFNLFEYHAFYRVKYWSDVTRHDLEILTSWLDSGPPLVLGALAAFGLLYVARRSPWPASLKREFYLCIWLAAALFAEVGLARPTFTRYFLLGVPFLAILAAVGLYALASRLSDSGRPVVPVLLFTLLIALGLGRKLYDRLDLAKWSDYEEVARKVDRVAPPNVPIFAEEPIYFLTRRTPPPGFELASYSHELNLPPARAALLHIAGEDEVKRRMKAGEFAAACTCWDSEAEKYAMPDLYRKSVEVHDCTIFWDFKR